jgi:hypothetical protein
MEELEVEQLNKKYVYLDDWSETSPGTLVDCV